MNFDVVKKIARRSLRIIIIVLILLIAVIIYYKFIFTYSDGYRAGLLQKFTRKGNIFKTYEGELILSSVTSNANVALVSEKFYFSVTDDSLASKLDTLQGQFIIIHYKQKNGKLFWRGETQYFVDSAKEKK
jgi:hypothetical protein